MGARDIWHRKHCSKPVKTGWADCRKDFSSVKPVPLNRLGAGAVVLARIVFADSTGDKVRPAVVLSVSRHEVQVLPLTTSRNRFRYPLCYVELEQWFEAGLSKPSGVERRPVMLERGDLVGVMGQLVESDWARVMGDSASASLVAA